MNIENYLLYKGAWINRSAPHLNEYISKKDCKELLNKGGVLCS